MKKKLIALVILVAVLGSVLSACSMFPINGDREYHQVVATVEYNGMTAELYRGELLAYVSANGSSLIQYGLSIDQVVEYFYNSLAQQKLLLLYAQEYVAKNGIGIDAVTDPAAITNMSKDPKNFLSVDEQRYCIEMTNKDFNDLWEENISELATEDKEEDEDQEEDEDLPEARPTRPEEEADTEYKDQGMTDASQLPALFEQQAKDKISAETDTQKKKDMESALNKLNKSLQDNYTDYNYYLRQQQEQRIIEKYKEALGKDVTITQEELDGRYNKLVNVNIAEYIDQETYQKAIEGGTKAYYHTNAGYLRVKSTLLQFTEDQKSVLSQIKSILGDTDPNGDVIHAFREVLALGDYANADISGMMGEFLVTADMRGIKVNVSNPDYDAEKDKKADAFTDRDVNFLTVLYAMANDIAAKRDMAEQAMAGKDFTALEQQVILDYAADQAFTDWLYLVNDDQGMFEGNPYLVTPDGTDSNYVEEYTVLARALGQTTLAQPTDSRYGTMAVSYATDNSKAVDLKAYEGNTAILTDNIGTGKATLYWETMQSTTKTGDEPLEAVVYTLVTAEGNAISFIINDYGIHVVMLEEEICRGEGASVYGSIQAKGEGFVYATDYLYDSEVTFTYNDDKSQITGIEVEVRTIMDYLRETRRDEIAADALSDQTTKLGLEKDQYISKNDKLYQDVIDYFNKK